MASYKLLIPGPVDVEDEVLSEMASPVPAHYGDEWMKVYLEIQVTGTAQSSLYPLSPL